ncbi:ubiquinol-cytochrome C chaperone [Alphaproteobacteria bacterium]|nr:ubiquinol-cytochrome C chaperone [Alphaproteobacteria bacterium]
MLFSLFPRRKQTSGNAASEPAEALYQMALSTSRTPSFYLEYGAEDSIDGRFDVLCLCVSLVMYRLRKIVRQQDNTSQIAQDVSQKLYDIMFADMDLTLREMGVGDLGVAKRVKIMSEAFAGRLTAYSSAFDELDASSLSVAFARNIGRREHAGNAELKLASLILGTITKLENCEDDLFLSGTLDLRDIAIS